MPNNELLTLEEIKYFDQVGQRMGWELARALGIALREEDIGPYPYIEDEIKEDNI